MNTEEKIRVAEEQTNTNPTEGQKIGGNYKKGKVTIKGLKISIENPKGSIRSGVDKNGNSWENVMPYTYGYFNGTVGKDGDQIDVYIGPMVDALFDVYIIDQVDEYTRAFDEHKVMFGFGSKEDALKAYDECYHSSWKGFGNITTVSLSKFKSWINNKDAIKYPASKLSMSEKVDFKNELTEEDLKIVELFGEVIEGETLKNLKAQAGDESSFKTLVVEIASPGGSVSEGLEIMVWLDSLSQQGKQIITCVVANAYSIASLIMLVADVKLISKHGEVMVHNPMVPQLTYANAEELEKYASELRNLESMMYDLYQAFTGLEIDVIKALMDKETYLSPQQAVDNGFADMVVDIKQRSFKMTTNYIKDFNMSKTVNILNKVIGMLNKSDFVNQLYYDTKGGEIEIYQKDPSTYAVGDRTNVEQGSVELSDGSTLLIEGYQIAEINREAKGDNVEEVNEFNEGPAPDEILTTSAEEMPIEAPATIKGKDDMPGKVIETTESITTTKETVAIEAEDACGDEKKMVDAPDEIPGETIEEEAPANLEDVEVLNALHEIMEKLASIEQRLEILESGSAVIEDKVKAFDLFEKTATEAIDLIAGNTVSKFVPSAKVEAKNGSTKSIFQQVKKKRGL